MRLRARGRDILGKIVLYDIRSGYWDWGLTVRFDSRGDERMDFFARVVCLVDFQGIDEAALYRRGGRRVDDIHAREATGVIRFRFPERLVRSTKHVRWRVDIWSTDQQHDTQGQDLAPDSGWYDH